MSQARDLPRPGMGTQRASMQRAPSAVEGSPKGTVLAARLIVPARFRVISFPTPAYLTLRMTSIKKPKHSLTSREGSCQQIVRRSRRSLPPSPPRAFP